VWAAAHTYREGDQWPLPLSEFVKNSNGMDVYQPVGLPNR
jgi:hypothetical protein